MKIGVSSYSFQQLISAGAESQLSIMEKAAAMGFDGIEFTDLQPPQGVSEAGYAQMLRAESDRLGLPIISYTVGANLLCDAGLDAEVERVCRKIDIAQLLGVPCLRHDAAWGMPESRRSFSGFAQALPTLAEGCRRITAYAAEKGIVTMVENHGTFCQESGRLEALVTAVGHPNFGVLADLGNFACADENSANAVGRLAPFVRHVHAKDFLIRSGNGVDPGRGFFRSRGGNYLRGTIVGHGRIPLLQCLRILKSSGYSGWYSIEFEGMEPCLEGIEIGLENLKKLESMI
ncbi:MAG: sugar phosphate isomerase/epimerase [Clostridia bacterium]|nr:sugar phosphate isomerase/epimerase [Clostridia bacterium]